MTDSDVSSKKSSVHNELEKNYKRVNQINPYKNTFISVLSVYKMQDRLYELAVTKWKFHEIQEAIEYTNQIYEERK